MRTFRLYISILLVTCSSTFCYGQGNSDWILSGGAIYSKRKVLGEVSVMNGLAVENIGMLGMKFGSEFGSGKKFFIAPKFGVEADLFFLSAKASLINYTDFKRYEPKLTPEIGLTVVGFVNVTYGYNIPLTSSRIDGVPKHRISIFINIPLSKHPAP